MNDDSWQDVDPVEQMVLLRDKMLGVRYPGGPSSGYIDEMSDGDDEDSDQNEEPEEEVATAAERPAARSEGPGGEILATVRPLGPVRSWVGLGVVRGVQLGPWPLGRWVGWPVTSTGDRHRGWLLHPSPVRTGAWRPGAEAARVLGSQAWAAAPSTCPGTRCNSASFGRAPSDRPSFFKPDLATAGTPEFLNQLEGGRDFVDEPPTNSTFCLHTSYMR
jgi:hypothetical protein